MRLMVQSALVALLTGCASSASREYEMDNAFCDQMATFAHSVPRGQQRSVRLARGGRMYVDHYKSCARSIDDPASVAFCEWLSENGSAEFMEANINQAVACLQGQRIRGSIGNTGVIAWQGEMTFWHTQLAEGVAAKLTYFIPPVERRTEEHFLEIMFERKD
ncbi:MAG TPA: hypothetical protein VGO52_10945 [Hyphomonadaceae bacterium]|nr:hypothetical protein [Hyphomonadaceae bacterium]